ncbi:MAG TPA: 4Fe-4S dicluster domain-containing protein [Gammaproteobacteria bacterium]|nr:4Fe-4S dicluster domain-containing protein [Gammaproteobacteria bacterium]
MSSKNDSSSARRAFLKGSVAAAAGLALAPGVKLIQTAYAKPDDETVTDAVRWGMLIDTNQCNDCNVCVEACVDENGILDQGNPSTTPQWIRKLMAKDRTTGHVVSLPMMCQHCENPPCADVCPTGASFRRADGIVLVDKHICIGCRYCMMACPYKARSFEHQVVTGQKPYAPRGKGTVEACTMCVHLVDKGKNPACVDACNSDGHKAMVFGDMNDPRSEISLKLMKYGGKQIRADLGLNTGIRYQGI